ncbi:MAG TPA: DNA polymerase III subunit delta [Candidatus Scybalomonas excrementigallinarum]|nr:DNA polymerase III subunit delta [Candidatus Scybalomonas excrementigallinarum]
MADLNSIIGQEQMIEHFKSAIEMDKVSHAYIIQGDYDSGKKLMASVFAKALQCEQKGTEPCNHCTSCLQADTGNQPDIIYVSHEKPNSIGIHDVREQINGSIGIKPYSSDYKIYIVDEAEKMTAEAQNALLKTIEEPPAYAVIFLLTTNLGKLLPTILSRCVVLNIQPVKDELIKKHLLSLGVEERQAEFCTAFSMGNVGKAIRVATSEEFNEIKNDCVHMLKYAKDMQVYELIQAVKELTKYKLQIYDYLDFMLMWYRDVLLLKATGNANSLIYQEQYSSIRDRGNQSSYEGIQKIIEEIEKAKVRLRANVNFELTIELLWLTIKEN